MYNNSKTKETFWINKVPLKTLITLLSELKLHLTNYYSHKMQKYILEESSFSQYPLSVYVVINDYARIENVVNIIKEVYWLEGQ